MRFLTSGGSLSKGEDTLVKVLVEDCHQSSQVTSIRNIDIQIFCGEEGLWNGIVQDSGCIGAAS